MKKIQTAIIGYGKSANVFHLPLLRSIPDYELRAFVSSQKEKILSEYPNAQIFTSIEELIANIQDLDLVVITTPNHLHYTQAKAALEAGLNVVIEKPFVTKIADGEELIQLANSRNKILSVYHNRRWDGGFLTLKKLLRENVLGDLLSLEIRFDRFRPAVADTWRDTASVEGSGTLYDIGSHFIDQVISQWGLPDKIVAELDSERQNADTVDYFHILFTYKSGLKVIIHSSSSAIAPTPHIVAQGRQASYIQYEKDPQAGHLINGFTPLDENFGLEKESSSFLFKATSDAHKQEKHPINTERGSYQSFYSELKDAILQGGSAPVTAQEALEVIKIIKSISAL